MRRPSSLFVRVASIAVALLAAPAVAGTTPRLMPLLQRPDDALAGSLRTTANQPAPTPEDLVFVTEDRAVYIDGCDAVSVFDASGGHAVHRGTTHISPGRLAASADLSTVVAQFTRGYTPFLYLLRRDDARDVWSASVVTGTLFAPVGAPAILPDGDGLLVPTVGAYDAGLYREPYGLYPPGPYELRRYSLSEMTAAGSDPTELLIGPAHATTVLGAVAVEIFPDRNYETVHVLTDDAVVHTLHAADLRPALPPIALPSLDGGRPAERGAVHTTHAAVTVDGRYMVTNRWHRREINVADLQERRSWTLPLGITTLQFGAIGGVAINHGEVNRGLLAVHLLGQRGGVLVYDFQPDRLTRRGFVRVTEPGPYDGQWVNVGGPKAAIAWSGTGRHLISATNDGDAEFVAFEVSDDGRRIEERWSWIACPNNEPTKLFSGNLPNDILTGNGLVLPPPTPMPTAGPSPTATFAPTATHTPEQSPTPTLSATTTPTRTSSPPSGRDPTATPTLSPMPPSATPTTEPPTSTNTAVPPSDTALPRPPVPIFLPLLLGEQCPPHDLFVDVVLVLDASTTMEQRDGAGRRKIDLATAAVRTFLRGLRLSPGADRAAIITFNESTDVRHRLSHDLSSLESSLSTITTRQFSRIDRGLRAAMLELLLPGTRANAIPVVVLLSDGLVNPVGDAEVLKAAEAVKGTGALVYVVGLGPNMAEPLLRSVATDPARYFRAADAGVLEAVYAELTRRVPCPPEAYWGGR